MNATYVIMKTHHSPIAIVMPTPHEVMVSTRGKVLARLDELNHKSVRNHYYAVKVKTQT